MGEIRCTLKQAQDGVPVPLDESTTIIVVPAVAQVTLKGRVFDSGRTFPLPRSVNALNEVFSTAVRLQSKHAVVIGHVHDGDPEPDALSEARARVLSAWLQGDPTIWVDQYSDTVVVDRRWGAREDQYLLSVALGDAAVPAAKDGEAGDPRARAFQTLAGITVDGIIGPVTRRKLAEKYFALSRLATLKGQTPPDNGILVLDTQVKGLGASVKFTLQQVADAKASGAEPVRESASPPAVDVQANPGPAGTETTTGAGSDTTEESVEANARIDFMFFFAESGPDPSPGSSTGPEFLEWVKQAELQRVAVVGAGRGNRLAIELRDKSGRTPHAGRKYKLAGPETLSGITSPRGLVEHDDVLAGDYTLTLTLEFFEGKDKIVDEYACSLVVLPADTPPQLRLLGAVPRCEVAILQGLLFETNKAFLVPEALSALRDIRSVYDAHNPSELLVVGHTDTTGSPSTNDSLSLERAKATLAYLQDDAEAWLEFYGTALPAERRWGEHEDSRMRELVPDPGLDRKALIRAYMQLDGAEVDAAHLQIPGTAHGCGEHFPLTDKGDEIETNAKDGKEDALDRRVELFFFDPEFGIAPKPSGEISKKGSTQYPVWRRLAKDSGAFGVDPARRIRIDDGASGFLADVSIKVTFATGEEQTFRTNAEGDIELPRDRTDAFVDITPEDSAVSQRVFLTFPPSSDRVGAWRRLVNLGYWHPGAVAEALPPPTPPNEEEFTRVIVEFQEDAGLDITGELDSETVDLLNERVAEDTAWKDHDWAVSPDAPEGAPEPKAVVA